MKLLMVTDIYGYTPHIESIVTELSDVFTGIKVIDPYGGGYLDFGSQQEAYDHFQRHCGLDNLTELVELALHSGSSRVVAVGFSVGASALWNLTEKGQSASIEKAVCFYGSRIREKTHVEPCCETIVVFPCHEDAYDVDALQDTLSCKKNVKCIKTPYLHGFMNQYSQNFDEEGFQTYMNRLKHKAGS